MNNSHPSSDLQQGNTAFRNNDYAAAIGYYLRALQSQDSAMAETIRVNFRFTRAKYRQARARNAKPFAAICSWDLADDVDDLDKLVKLYRTCSAVEIIGTLFPGSGSAIPQALRKVEVSVHRLEIVDKSRFFDRALEFVSTQPYDILHLVTPHITNIFIGILYMLVWDAKVLISRTLNTLPQEGRVVPVSVEDYIRTNGKLPGMSDLDGKEWGRLAAGLAERFDMVKLTGTVVKIGTLVDSLIKRDASEDFLPSWCLRLLEQTPLAYLVASGRAKPQRSASAGWSGENGAHLSQVQVREEHDLESISLEQQVAKKDLQETIELLAASRLFYSSWYLSKYNDVARWGLDPVAHYLRYGAEEGRDPSPWFSTSWYLKEYQDVQRAGINPLVHYLRYGRHEGRRPVPPSSWDRPWWSEYKPELQTRAVEMTEEKESPVDVRTIISRMTANSLPPAIIVPVYNAPQEVDDCLKSLIRHTGEYCRILVIDDASPNSEIKPLLERYSNSAPVEVYHNETNLGFTRTINRGIEMAGDADVVLLNSDTKVTPGWLRNLRLAVYSEERIGTATPFSNNAGAFSTPIIDKNNALPVSLSLEEYARAISQTARRVYPKVPTGNGYCLYIRRDCLNEVGLFDAEAFPRGYGEENDFCMRAGRLGWSHVVDDATLIYHVRTASFGEAKTDLLKKGREVIDGRYPEYSQAIQIFRSSEQLNEARRQIGAVANAFSPETERVKPRVLYVLSTRFGGTPQTNQDLMTALDDRIEAFVLCCNAAIISLEHYRKGIYTVMEMHVLSQQLKAFPHRSEEYDAVVANWLAKYAIELVHVRHIAWHGLGLLDISKALGLLVVFSFHDYYCICPTIKLLDKEDRYCGGFCTDSKGECRHELWTEHDFPPLKSAAIEEWQRQFRQVLGRCDLFVTTTESARKVICENYPVLSGRPFYVIPHGRDFKVFEQLAQPVRKNDKIRILIPGNISKAKGAGVISRLGKVAETAGLELHLLGDVSEDVEISSGIICHGTYLRDQFMEKVREIKPHLGGIFSIWPETYCHTLTELWACGVPVIGFDFGAVGDRIRQSSAGWLAKEPTAEGVLEIIDRLRSDDQEQREKLEAVRKWQTGTAGNQDCRQMSNAYYDLYRSIIDRNMGN